MRTYVRLGLLLTALVALGVVAGGGTPAYAWSYPAALNTNAASDSGADDYPQVTTDGTGNWVAVWPSNDSLGDTIGGDWDILVARSTNNGATWTAPAALNTNAASDSDSGVDEFPQVTTDGGGNWVAVWQSNDGLGGTIGTDYDILVARSTDNGATWTDPAALNSNAASDSDNDRKPQVTTDGGGNNWVAVWEYSDGDGDILVARSTDNGATWTDPAALSTSPGSHSARDHDPQLTTDGEGNWVAVWYSQDSLGGTIDTDYDILVARSTDNGATWTDPAALNTNAASDSGSVDYGPQVTTDGGGNWVAVWSSDDSLGGTIGGDWDILVARSTDNGATWTYPAALNTNAASDSGPDDSPQVTTDGGGNWVAVWASYGFDSGCHDILVARSTDNGVTWTAPAAPTNCGGAGEPQVTTDGGGNWVVVWWSYWEDGDILYSTEVWPLAPVGGIAELPGVSDSPGRNYIALVALAGGAVFALTAGGWYARRRRLG